MSIVERLHTIRDQLRTGRFGQREVWEEWLTDAAAEIERLTALCERYSQEGATEIACLLIENERLRAAIAWTREVRPGKNSQSGGAIVHMTWDQFSTMRALAEPIAKDTKP
jgi:hypothetical protein